MLYSKNGNGITHLPPILVSFIYILAILDQVSASIAMLLQRLILYKHINQSFSLTQRRDHRILNSFSVE